MRAGDGPVSLRGAPKKGGVVAAFPLPCFQGLLTPEFFQFETLCVSNPMACRFAEKTRFFRSLWAGRRRAAASRFTFLYVEAL